LKRKIIITYNSYDRSIRTAKILRTKLASAGFEVLEKPDPEAELFIAIGGDGSFLKTLHDYDFPEVPIIGINTGHLGFFQEIMPPQIDNFIDAYINKRYTIQEIHPIEALICTRTSCVELQAINEFVVKGDKSRTIHLNLSVNTNFIECFSGDGVILSTPTGSTAYNYSSGGSIVDPSLKLIQITPLSPINTNAYRSFTSSIILPSDAIVKISPEYRFEDSLVFVTDGIEHRYNQIVDLTFQTSTINIKLLRLGGYEFWSKVTEKFL
jgi:NAD+ kinase